MKKMRQIALPLAILLIGAGSAYATNVASDTSTKAETPGWRINPASPSAPCVITEQNCSTIDNGVTCTMSDGNVDHDLYETGCQDELFKIL